MANGPPQWVRQTAAEALVGAAVPCSADMRGAGSAGQVSFVPAVPAVRATALTTARASR